ncbi:MAG: insulinase family protein [Alphaproteobacteria bacterium]|nr:insulinase family protein [Alphaproteobacteria bacterium]
MVTPLFPLWACAALAMEPDLSALRLSPTTATLDNGLTVAVHEDHRAPIVAISLRYRVGAAEDPPGASGTAHLFEHLMFEGTERVPSGQYDALLAAAGATNNAWTDHDWTTYQVQGPPEVLDLALFLEADRLAGLSTGLKAEDIANQRDVVLNERLGDEITDDIYPIYALHWLVWPYEHPYSLPVLGTRVDVQGAERDTLVAFFEAHYVASNAVLTIVGDVDAQEAIALAERHLGALPLAPAPARVGPEDWPRGDPGWVYGRFTEERWVMLEDIDDQALYVAWNTVPRGHPDEPALDVLSMVLSGAQGTRLDDPLYYRRSRATGLSVWTGNGRLGGTFVFHATRDDRRLKPLLRVLDRELDRIRETPPSQEEIDRAISIWWADTVRALEDHEALADAIGECIVTFDEPDCLADDLGRYLAVTPEDVQRVANTWLVEQRVVLSVVSAGERRLEIPGSAEVYAP